MAYVHFTKENMKNTKFNWKCIYCQKRNINIIKFQFDIPQKYTAQWQCKNCGKETKIKFDFNIYLPDRLDT